MRTGFGCFIAFIAISLFIHLMIIVIDFVTSNIGAIIKAVLSVGLVALIGFVLMCLYMLYYAAKGWISNRRDRAE